MAAYELNAVKRLIENILLFVDVVITTYTNNNIGYYTSDRHA